MKKSFKAIIQAIIVIMALLTVAAWHTSSAAAADTSLQRVKQRGN